MLKHKIICLCAKPRVLQCHIGILLNPKKFVLHLPEFYDMYVIFLCVDRLETGAHLLVNQYFERGNRRLNLMDPHRIIFCEILLPGCQLILNPVLLLYQHMDAVLIICFIQVLWRFYHALHHCDILPHLL